MNQNISKPSSEYHSEIESYYHFCCGV